MALAIVKLRFKCTILIDEHVLGDGLSVSVCDYFYLMRANAGTFKYGNKDDKSI